MNNLEKVSTQLNSWKVLSSKFNKILFFLFLPSIIYGQGLPPSAAREIFDTNFINTLVGPGSLMWDLSDARYEVPKDSGKLVRRGDNKRRHATVCRRVY